jgi:tetratricopeptide (TPR) repeat protein
MYATRPQLASLPYLDQLNTLIQDRYLGSQLYAEELRAIGADAHILIANCEPLQRAWAHENDISSKGASWLSMVLVAQVTRIRPDVLLITDPCSIDSRFVRLLPIKPTFVVGLRTGMIPAWADFTAFDLILSGEQFSKELPLAHGATASEHIAAGFASRFISFNSLRDANLELVCVGGNERDVPLLEQLSFYANATREFTPTFIDTPPTSLSCAWVARHAQSSLWGMALYNTLHQTKLAITNIPSFGSTMTSEISWFEVTGCGAMLLTEENALVGRYFDVGGEVETYSCFDELTEKVRYYSAHAAEREEIARRGHARCLREHSLGRRTEELLEILQRHVSSLGLSPREDSPPPPNTLVSRSIEQIRTGRIEESYKSALKALKHYPQERFVHYMLGLNLLKMERVQEARDALTTEVSLHPDAQEARELLRSLAKMSPGESLLT